VDYCVFSKRLQSLGFAELGAALGEAGFEGVDLTVRPGGHVEPEAVAGKLPEAVAALGAAGVAVKMISTGITSLGEPGARATLETAAAQGIRFAKLGYFKYGGFGTIRRSLDEAAGKLRELAAAAGDLGVFLGCHNHSGGFVGAHLAHLVRLVDGLDPEAIGIYFDPVHAVLEGGRGGWLQSLDDAAPRVRMLAVKDFTTSPEGGIDCVPLGEGVVPWSDVAAAIRELAPRIGPVSIHTEKDQPAAAALELARSDRSRFESYLRA
jgi:sugar phosphate isomerase/epimerase